LDCRDTEIKSKPILSKPNAYVVWE
jgi:hypothetical protein